MIGTSLPQDFHAIFLYLTLFSFPISLQNLLPIFIQISVQVWSPSRLYLAVLFKIIQLYKHLTFLVFLACFFYPQHLILLVHYTFTFFSVSFFFNRSISFVETEIFVWFNLILFSSEPKTMHGTWWAFNIYLCNEWIERKRALIGYLLEAKHFHIFPHLILKRPENV